MLTFCYRIFEFFLKSVQAWSVAEENCPDPKTKSFDTVKQCAYDPLLPAKLSFFLSVANIVNPFLTTYQTDKPMLWHTVQASLRNNENLSWKVA